MSPDQSLAQLRQRFLETAFVKDAKLGYVVAKDFNLVIQPDILELAAHCWQAKYQDLPIDAVVGLPDAGSRLVPVLAQRLQTAAILPSKRTTTLPGSWEKVVSYSNKSFTTNQANILSHIGFVQPGMKILLVDDVVANGDTAVAAIKALQAADVEVVGLAVLFDKVWQGGVERITQETGVEPYSLVRIKSLSPQGQVVLV